MRSKTCRRPFLLLEMLLAVAIIGLSSTWLIASPVKIYEKHLRDLKLIELSHIADVVFLKIQCSLHEKHPWESLVKDSCELHDLADVMIHLPSIFSEKYFCKYQLREKRGKEGRDGSLYKLVECIIYAAPSLHLLEKPSLHSAKVHSFRYLIFTKASKTKQFV